VANVPVPAILAVIGTQLRARALEQQHRRSLGGLDVDIPPLVSALLLLDVTLACHASYVKRPDGRRKSFQRDDPNGNGDGAALPHKVGFNFDWQLGFSSVGYFRQMRFRSDKNSTRLNSGRSENGENVV
jgi:hypothetical protein